MSDCIFCSIVDRKIPAKIQYEDDQVLAFDDIHPQAPVHVVIIPKKHYATLNDIPAKDLTILSSVFNAAREVAKKKGIDARGYRVAVNTNNEGGQFVDHVHFHLVGGKQLGNSLIG